MWPHNYYWATNCQVFEQPKSNGRKVRFGEIPTLANEYALLRCLNLQPMLAVFTVVESTQLKVSHRTAGQASSEAGPSNPGAAGKPPRLLDQVRARMRRLGLARRTEEVYVSWIRRFILSQGKRHPRELGAPEVEAFLTELAVRNRVAASTQNQALAALLFLYREVLGIELP